MMTNYKVLSLWEPYASLLVHGIKKIETRPKPTNWTLEKGTYLIHSTKWFSKGMRDICMTEPFYSELKKIHHVWASERFGGYHLFRLGCIIGSIEVFGCYKIQVIDNKISYWIKYDNLLPDLCFVNDYKEISFGDYREGRYAWICKNPKILKNPIPYKNGQGYYQNYNGDTNLIKFIDD